MSIVLPQDYFYTTRVKIAPVVAHICSQETSTQSDCLLESDRFDNTCSHIFHLLNKHPDVGNTPMYMKLRSFQ